MGTLPPPLKIRRRFLTAYPRLSMAGGMPALSGRSRARPHLERRNRRDPM